MQAFPASFSPHRPLSPRSALRSLQNPQDATKHAGSYNFGCGAGPLIASDRESPSTVTVLTDNRPGQRLPPGFHQIASPPSMQAGERGAAPLSSYVSRLPPSPLHVWPDQLPCRQRPHIWYPPTMFGPESVSETSHRSTRQHAYLSHAAQPSRTVSDSGSGSASTSSAPASSHLFAGRSLPTSPDQDLYHPASSSGAGSSSSSKTNSSVLYEHPSSRPYTPDTHYEAPVTARSDEKFRHQSENPFAFSLATPRVDMAGPAGVAGRPPRIRQAGSPHHHETFSSRHLPSTGPQNSSSRVSPSALQPESQPSRSVDDYLPPLYRKRHGSTMRDSPSMPRSSAPFLDFQRSGSCFSKDPRPSFSPALSEGSSTCKASPADFDRTSLPPMLSGGGGAAAPHSIGLERQHLSHRYSPPTLHLNDYESKSSALSPLADSTSASSSPRRIGVLKRPRQLATQADKSEKVQFGSSSSVAKADQHRLRPPSLDGQRSEASAQSPEQNMPSHAEVMHRLKTMVTQRMKAASISTSSSPSDAITTTNHQ